MAKGVDIELAPLDEGHVRAKITWSEQDAGGGDDQDQRIAQRVFADGPPLAESLGAGGADVVLAEHVEHRRARHAGKKADLEQRQDQRR